MIDGKNFFDQLINSDLKTYGSIIKITTVPGDDYSYFKNYYKMIAIDLSKQQVVHADPRAIQQINFKANTTMFFIIEETKETVLDFSQETEKLSTIKAV